MIGRRAVAVAGMGLVLLSGCSDSKDSDEQSAPTTAVVRTTATTTTVPRQISGGPFCEFALTFNDRFARVGTDASNPARLRATFEEGVKAIEDAQQIAPAEIKEDVSVLATTMRDLATMLNRANYDASRLSPTAIHQLASPELKAAGERLEAYTKENCRSS